MTIQSITYAIARLIKKRKKFTGDDEEQSKINCKLDKLYDLKYIALQQESKNKVTVVTPIN